MLHIKLVRTIIEPLERGTGLLVIVNQGEYTEELTSERRRMWISAISRDDLLMTFSNAIGSAAGISFQEKLRKIGIDSTWTGSLPSIVGIQNSMKRTLKKQLFELLQDQQTKEELYRSLDKKTMNG